MQLHVKTGRIEIKIKGEIPVHILEVLKNEYRRRLKITDEEDDSHQVKAAKK